MQRSAADTEAGPASWDRTPDAELPRPFVQQKLKRTVEPWHWIASVEKVEFDCILELSVSGHVLQWASQSKR